MSVIDIPSSATRPLPKGTYRRLGRYQSSEHTAIIACADCGEESILDHDIAPDGTITPSVECPACKWHVHGRLIGWTP
jgi:hypothetical protein